ncbi:iron-siderophore ABC transporter substrate-binding protein [Nocardia cyriacigeorgica]|uniref:iron-siderophore ABC transporter substrate-binding protein n=1 Tax=Nocardia cyriacigeorgica TaxID=135487 RepID=UPI00245894EC|nr:iron-siderophore ABC transporter substrate-binding protein [Nocardia cyriacigeorgica]
MGTTTVGVPPKSVVALDPSFTDAALLLDAPLTGYVQYRADPDHPFPDYLGDLGETVAASVNVGTTAEPDLEQILELEPDLIISAKVRHEPLYDQLSKIAPTVFSSTTGPTWKQNILLLGEALGKKTRAQELITGYEERAAAVGEQIRAADPDVTYSLVRFTGEGTARLYSSNSFIGNIMTDMAIPRPEDAPDSNDVIFTPLSAEQILRADAGIIMVSAYTPPGAEGDAGRDQQAAYEANPLWQRLSGDVIEVDDEPFVLSVSLQGAHASITKLAEHFGVDPRLDLIPS